MFASIELAPGVNLHHYQTSRFKTLALTSVWRVPLDAGQVTSVALIPALSRRGTRSWPTTQSLARRYEELYGSRISSHVYKLGEEQLWWMVLELPHPHLVRAPELARDALQMLTEMTWEPLADDRGFREDYVREEKEVLRRALQARFNNKAAWANLRCVQEMCAGERYALHPLGREEDLPGLDGASLYRTYRDITAGGRQDILAIGDWASIANGHLADLLAPLFPKGKRPLVPEPPLEVKPGRPRLQEIVERQPVNQGKVVIGLRTCISMGHPLYPALLFWDGLLGRYAHSKLFANVREKSGLAYYANTILDVVKGIVLMVAGIDFGAYAKTRDLCLEQLSALARGEFGDLEWEQTHRSLRSEITSWIDEPDSLTWGKMQAVVSGTDFSPSDLVKALDRVTKDQVVEVATQVKPDTVYFLTREDT